ncbi:hypothetical protein ET445_03490 [Agromyces protaetiae]|uniref:4'-phosphopantetheinyl transferase superfamily protein n=1 Tax=Agromyces protaetiae TaxID=2509455 RepID=A0A4P6FA88_9MICO|nr:hypothetical protein [Agromyces protaetiae]QAY72545.1 hypothetical protein ET445_03490 [Agromyces protaetiae]
MPLAEASLAPGDAARLAEEPVAKHPRFLSGRAALMLAASRFAGVDPSDPVDLRIDARCPDCGRSHGRPTVTGAPRPVFVSLAHAGGRAFAVASAVPVGIDTEPVDVPAERRAAVASAVRDLAPPPVGVDPLAHWTRIEAVLKADGRGLRVDPGRVVFKGRGARIDGGEQLYRVRTRRRGGFIVSVAHAG